MEAAFEVGYVRVVAEPTQATPMDYKVPLECPKIFRRSCPSLGYLGPAELLLDPLLAKREDALAGAKEPLESLDTARISPACQKLTAAKTPALAIHHSLTTATLRGA